MQARYKGKTYNLIWEGKTKHGERAKLGFLDGTKEFWVDSSKITKTNGKLPNRGRCRGCDGDIFEDEMNGVAIDGYCERCAFDEFDC